MNDALERARVLLEQGRHDLAEPYLRDALTAAPRDAEVMCQLALTLAQLGKLEEAERLARDAVAAGPELAVAHFALGGVLAHRNTADSAALVALQQSHALDPNHLRTLTTIAAILMRQRRWPEAQRCLQRALALNPSDSATLSLHAVVLAWQNEPRRSQDVLETSLAADPDDAFTHASRGAVMLRTGRYREALDSFVEALRINPMMRFALRGKRIARAALSPVLGIPVRVILRLHRLSKGKRVMLLLLPVACLWVIFELEPAYPQLAATLLAFQVALMTAIGLFVATSVWLRLLQQNPWKR